MIEQAIRDRDEVQEELLRQLRSAVMAALSAAVLISRRRAQAARQNQARDDAQLRDFRAYTRPLMEQVWRDRWWKDASPEKIGRYLQTAAEWAPADPYSAATLTYMLERLKDRYDLQVPSRPQPTYRSLSEALATLDTSPTGPAAQEPATARPEMREVSYIIRLNDNGEQVAGGRETLAHDEGRPDHIVAADQLIAFDPQQVSVDNIAGLDKDAGHFIIELYDAAGTRLYGPLRDDEAVQLRADYEQWRAQIVTGEAVDALKREQDELRDRLAELPDDAGQQREDLQRRLTSLQERLHTATEELQNALHVEHSVLHQRAQSLRSQLDQYATDQPHDERWEQLAQELEDTTRQSAQVGLRLRAVQADLRGENGDHVLQAAALRRGMDEGWWNTAHPAEIAGVWDHVHGWQNGEGRESALSALRAELWRQYDLDPPEGASGHDVQRQIWAVLDERYGGSPTMEYLITSPATTPGQPAHPVARGFTHRRETETLPQLGRRLATEHYGAIATGPVEVTFTRLDGTAETSVRLEELPEPARLVDEADERAQADRGGPARGDTSRERAERDDAAITPDRTAEDRRTAAEQDRAAEATYQQLQEEDPELADAIGYAAIGFEGQTAEERVASSDHKARQDPSPDRETGPAPHPAHDPDPDLGRD